MCYHNAAAQRVSRAGYQAFTAPIVCTMQRSSAGHSLPEYYSSWHCSIPGPVRMIFRSTPQSLVGCS